jgi:hypothetical protein
MHPLITVSNTNATNETVAAQGFDAFIDALVTSWKPERQRVAPMSARSMALMGFRCPASDALMVSPYIGNASRPTRRHLPAVRVSR